MFSAFQSNAFQTNAFQIVVDNEVVIVHDSFAFDTKKRYKKKPKLTIKKVKIDDTALNEAADTVINKMFGEPEKVKVKKQKPIKLINDNKVIELLNDNKVVELLNDNIEQTNIINLALARKQRNKDISLILLLC
jgi:hypothetical protein